MTRWFKLTQSTTYEWKSKRSGKFYQFVGDKIVAVDDARDQERFTNLPDRFVEVDERGNVIDSATGQVLPASFSRKGMVKPKTYTKLAKATTEEPPKPVPAPRTVVSSTKKAEPPAPETPAAAPTPAEDKAEPEVTAEEAPAEPEGTGDAPESSDGSDDASEDSAPTKRTKKSSKKKSGRKGDK